MSTYEEIEYIKVSETPFLYHYQRDNLEWIENLLINKKIYFSSPESFNDPWDCRACYDENCVDDPVELQRQVEYFKSAALKQGVSKKELDELTQIWLSDREVVRRAIRKSSLDVTQGISEQYRVFCLTKNPTNILMWAHYTDAHKGVCLEFSTKNNVFCTAFKVKYSKSYLKHNFAIEYPQNIFPLIVKANVWEYEDEYRLIAEVEEKAKGVGTLRTNENFLIAPDKSLTAIILGARMSPDKKEKIRNLVKSIDNSVLIKDAMIPNRYEITIS